MSKKRPLRLRQASAYFRLAAKAERHGQDRDAARYRQIAERFINAHNRQVEWLRARGL